MFIHLCLNYYRDQKRLFKKGNNVYHTYGLFLYKVIDYVFNILITCVVFVGGWEISITLYPFKNICFLLKNFSSLMLRILF